MSVKFDETFQWRKGEKGKTSIPHFVEKERIEYLKKVLCRGQAETNKKA